jgi:hypothetical protein
MATGRSRKLTSCLVLAALLPLGCAQPGPFTSRQTMVGSLKASVSQLEFENEKLRKEVGELKADNSRLDTLLTQEQDANGEITARLDDARDLIRRQGGNAQALGAPSKNFEDDNIPPPVATPRGQRAKSSRKPPATRIPQIEAAPFGSSSGDDLGYQPPSRTPRDLGPTDSDDEDRWLPVARGLGSTVTRQ